MKLPYLIRIDPKDPRGERMQIIILRESTPMPAYYLRDNYCICDGCKNSAGCSWKPLEAPYTSCVGYKWEGKNAD